MATFRNLSDTNYRLGGARFHLPGENITIDPGTVKPESGWHKALAAGRIVEIAAEPKAKPGRKPAADATTGATE
jgi:hypothetical protein